MKAELDVNFKAFETRWKSQWEAAEKGLRNDNQFRAAFDRLVSLQAWRSELLDGELPDEAMQFVLEGQNDMLVAYIFARTGQWRSSLQSQRAAIESYLNALYFVDHPVELELWARGRFKTQFTDNLKYFQSHPKLYQMEPRFCGIDLIKKEYATLSLAVHGSAKAFRMTKDTGPKYFLLDDVEKGQWSSRNRSVVRGLNLLLLSLFSQSLIGTKKRNLRKSIALALRKKDKDWIKKVHSVTIPFE